jgi:hypothetical protein
MTVLRVLMKAVTRVVWLLGYPATGMAVFGRGLHVSWHSDDQHGAVAAPAQAPALTPDEVLWAAELAARDDV